MMIHHADTEIVVPRKTQEETGERGVLAFVVLHKSARRAKNISARGKRSAALGMLLVVDHTEIYCAQESSVCIHCWTWMASA